MVPSQSLAYSKQAGWGDTYLPSLWDSQRQKMLKSFVNTQGLDKSMWVASIVFISPKYFTFTILKIILIIQKCPEISLPRSLPGNFTSSSKLRLGQVPPSGLYSFQSLLATDRHLRVPACKGEAQREGALAHGLFQQRQGLLTRSPHAAPFLHLPQPSTQVWSTRLGSGWWWFPGVKLQRCFGGSGAGGQGEADAPERAGARELRGGGLGE